MTDQKGKTPTSKLHGSKDKKNHLPHDALFKTILTQPAAAKEFLEEYVPQKIKERLDLTTISIESESYIEPELTKRFSDLVFKTKTKNNDDAFVYCLVEHQSTIDHTIAFRLWRYILLLAEKYIDKKNSKAKIPLIFPIVLYAGKHKYTAARNLWQLFEDPELAKEILTNDHALVDLHSMPDKDIARKKLLALLEYMLKYSNSPTHDLVQLFQSLLEKHKKSVTIDKEYGYFCIKSIIHYIDKKLPEQRRDEIGAITLRHLPTKEGETIMRTIADYYIDQGIEKGREEGIEKAALAMLKENSDPKFVASVTGFSLDHIAKLKASL